MKTTTYRQTDAYDITVTLDVDLVTHLATASWEQGDLAELDYAARQLHHYTGVRAALLGDGGAVLALHLWGDTSYSVLADDMGGQPSMMVLYLDRVDDYLGVERAEWRPLFQQDFATWQQLAQAAAAINLRG